MVQINHVNSRQCADGGRSSFQLHREALMVITGKNSLLFITIRSKTGCVWLMLNGHTRHTSGTAVWNTHIRFHRFNMHTQNPGGLTDVKKFFFFFQNTQKTQKVLTCPLFGSQASAKTTSWDMNIVFLSFSPQYCNSSQASVATCNVSHFTDLFQQLSF